MTGGQNLTVKSAAILRPQSGVGYSALLAGDVRVAFIRPDSNPPRLHGHLWLG
jgi:hypothetical protein